MNPQTVFLTTLVAGIVSLVAALGMARWNWRKDIPAFGRGHNVFTILCHPERYANPEALRWIEFLAFAGAWLLAAAIGALGFQLVNGTR